MHAHIRTCTNKIPGNQIRTYTLICIRRKSTYVVRTYMKDVEHPQRRYNSPFKQSNKILHDEFGGVI